MNRQQKQQLYVITGASCGFGKAIAMELITAASTSSSRSSSNNTTTTTKDNKDHHHHDSSSYPFKKQKFYQQP